MNKKLIFSAMLVCSLAFSLVFVSCGGKTISGIYEPEDTSDMYRFHFDKNGMCIITTKVSSYFDPFDVEVIYSIKGNKISFEGDGSWLEIKDSSTLIGKGLYNGGTYKKK
jgi:hypothetical protein